MEKTELYILELDSQKCVYNSKKELIDSLEFELDIEDNENIFSIYSKEFTNKEINEMPEFDGF